jgi:hypothetical protein
MKGHIDYVRSAYDHYNRSADRNEIIEDVARLQYKVAQLDSALRAQAELIEDYRLASGNSLLAVMPPARADVSLSPWGDEVISVRLPQTWYMIQRPELAFKQPEARRRMIETAAQVWAANLTSHIAEALSVAP